MKENLNSIEILNMLKDECVRQHNAVTKLLREKMAIETEMNDEVITIKEYRELENNYKLIKEKILVADGMCLENNGIRDMFENKIKEEE